MSRRTTRSQATPPTGARTVGIRELKARMSSFLRQVRSGDAVVITDRGKPIGQILPLGASLDTKLRQMTNSDVASWSGRKLRASVPKVPVKGRTTVGQLLLDDRE